MAVGSQGAPLRLSKSNLRRTLGTNRRAHICRGPRSGCTGRERAIPEKSAVRKTKVTTSRGWPPLLATAPSGRRALRRSIRKAVRGRRCARSRSGYIRGLTGCTRCHSDGTRIYDIFMTSTRNDNPMKSAIQDLSKRSLTGVLLALPLGMAVRKSAGV